MNPYKAVENIGRAIYRVLMWLLAAFAVALVFVAGVALALREGWGWWSLLVIPGIPAALCVIVALVALWWMLSDAISGAWRRGQFSLGSRAPSHCPHERSAWY